MKMKIVDASDLQAGDPVAVDTVGVTSGAPQVSSHQARNADTAAPAGSIDEARALKARGLSLFREGNGGGALACFDQAAAWCEAHVHDELHGAHRRTLAVDCLNNSAQLLLKAEKWQEASARCRRALALCPGNQKARFRNARAVVEQLSSPFAGPHPPPISELDAVRADLVGLHANEPANQQILELIDKADDLYQRLSVARGSSDGSTPTAETETAAAPAHDYHVTYDSDKKLGVGFNVRESIASPLEARSRAVCIYVESNDVGDRPAVGDEIIAVNGVYVEDQLLTSGTPPLKTLAAMVDEARSMNPELHVTYRHRESSHAASKESGMMGFVERLMKQTTETLSSMPAEERGHFAQMMGMSETELLRMTTSMVTDIQRETSKEVEGFGEAPREDDGPPREDDGPPREDDGPPRQAGGEDADSEAQQEHVAAPKEQHAVHETSGLRAPSTRPLEADPSVPRQAGGRRETPGLMLRDTDDTLSECAPESDSTPDEQRDAPGYMVAGWLEGAAAGSAHDTVSQDSLHSSALHGQEQAKSSSVEEEDMATMEGADLSALVSSMLGVSMQQKESNRLQSPGQGVGGPAGKADAMWSSLAVEEEAQVQVFSSVVTRMANSREAFLTAKDNVRSPSKRRPAKQNKRADVMHSAWKDLCDLEDRQQSEFRAKVASKGALQDAKLKRTQKKAAKQGTKKKQAQPKKDKMLMLLDEEEQKTRQIFEAKLRAKAPAR